MICEFYHSRRTTCSQVGTANWVFVTCMERKAVCGSAKKWYEKYIARMQDGFDYCSCGLTIQGCWRFERSIS